MDLREVVGRDLSREKWTDVTGEKIQPGNFQAEGVPEEGACLAYFRNHRKASRASRSEAGQKWSEKK